MRLQEIKMSVLHQRDLNKARRVAQRAFSFRRAAYHYEYLDRISGLNPFPYVVVFQRCDAFTP